MPTHAIGHGTVNVALNMPAPERAVLGRLACEAGQSLNAFIREQIVVALLKQKPKAAAEILEARQNYRKQQTAGIVCLLAFVAVVASGQEFARAGRRVGRRDEVQLVEGMA